MIYVIIHYIFVYNSKYSTWNSIEETRKSFPKPIQAYQDTIKGFEAIKIFW